ncbi:MAG: transposase family protein [Bacteroides sp.]|nr:transposase family protein [Bacteroides sp.]
MNKTKPLNQVRSIEDAMLNHSTNVQNKSIQKGSILDHLMNFAASVPDFRRCNKGNIRHRLKDIIILMILGRTCGHI